MASTKRTVIFLGASLLGLVVGWFMKSSTEYGFCLESEPTCINNLTWIGNGLFYGMGALAIIFAILFFVPQAFRVWKKFAIWFVPLAALLFILYPEPGSGDFLSPYPEQVFQWVSALYVLVSIIIIAIASRRTQ